MTEKIADAALIDPDDILVQKSAISGDGLFAGRAYGAAEPLMLIYGDPIDEAEALRRERDEQNWYIYWNHGRNFIDAAQTPKGRFLNHACVPNCRTLVHDERSLLLVALRAIAVGEELTMDYDYPEIYAVCRTYNPGCLGDACPQTQARSQGEHR